MYRCPTGRIANHRGIGYNSRITWRLYYFAQCRAVPAALVLRRTRRRKYTIPLSLYGVIKLRKRVTFPMRKTESQKIALCGVLVALSVVLMLAGSALQLGTYAAPMLAAFLLIPVLEEYGTRYALLLYGAAAVLAVLLVPETELALFYALVIGYYPVLCHALCKVRPAVLRWGLKLLVFNVATALVYGLLFALFGPVILQELVADGTAMAVVLLATGNLAFVLCDRALGAVTRYYRLVLRKKVNRFF